MKRKLYPTDLTDKQWAILSPLIPLAKTGGRPRQNLREVVNGIFYILCGGCTADDAKRFPSLENGLSLLPLVAHCWVWQQMNQALRERVRQQAGRQLTPVLP